MQSTACARPLKTPRTGPTDAFAARWQNARRFSVRGVDTLRQPTGTDRFATGHPPHRTVPEGHRPRRVGADSHFAQRKPMAQGGIEETRSIEETSMESEPRGPEIPRLEGPVGQSRGNPDPVDTALAKA